MVETELRPEEIIPPPDVILATEQWRNNFFGRLATAANRIGYIGTTSLGISGVGAGAALHFGRPDVALVTVTIGLSSSVVPIVAGVISEGIARRITE